MIEKFVLKLQTPINDTDPGYSLGKLERAVGIAKEIEKLIYNQNRFNEKGRQDKFRSIMAMLIKKKELRQELVNGVTTSIKLFTMKREDFMSAELKRQNSEAE